MTFVVVHMSKEFPDFWKDTVHHAHTHSILEFRGITITFQEESFRKIFFYQLAKLRGRWNVEGEGGGKWVLGVEVVVGCFRWVPSLAYWISVLVNKFSKVLGHFCGIGNVAVDHSCGG